MTALSWVIAEEIPDQLLPEKSSDLSMKAYKTFKNWCSAKNVFTIPETLLLVYLKILRIVKKPPLYGHNI